jgi:hypothetical protein
MDVVAALAVFGWLGILCWALWSALGWLSRRVGRPPGETLARLVLMGWLFNR